LYKINNFYVNYSGIEDDELVLKMKTKKLNKEFYGDFNG
jgi:hypothetical protein